MRLPIAEALPAATRRLHQLLTTIVAASCVGGPIALAAPNAAPDAAALEFFEKKIRPLLVENCYTCHSAETNAKSGLRVDDRNGLLSGGNRGPAVVPGRPADSVLLKAVSYADPRLKMPPEGKLSDEQIADLTNVDQRRRGVARRRRAIRNRPARPRIRPPAPRTLGLATAAPSPSRRKRLTRHGRKTRSTDSCSPSSKGTA